MVNSGVIKGTPASPRKLIPKCDSCVLGKQTQTPIPKTRAQGGGHKAKRRLEKVWVDLAGPNDVASRTGAFYVMNIVDDYSSLPWSITLKNKSSAFEALQNWQRM
jgi:hypothetical protein